jgi:hypothetical protein
MGMALTGRRSKLGSLHGPMNQESVNGTHPAMLAAHQFNSDVQLPYRFPITEETHSPACDGRCYDGADEAVIVQAAQASQDAQAGYACDYSNKRQPMAFNEVKECCKGHARLGEKLSGEHVNPPLALLKKVIPLPTVFSPRLASFFSPTFHRLPGTKIVYSQVASFFFIPFASKLLHGALWMLEKLP